MENKLYREKSMDRISSPEQLQDYMRVTTPGTWMLLAAVIVLLGGLLVCSVLGRLETRVPATAVVEDGSITVSVQPQGNVTVSPGMVLRVSGQECKLTSVRLDAEGQTTATASADLPDGTYEAEVVTEIVSPIRFLIN